MQRKSIVSITMSDLEELGLGICCFCGFIGLGLCFQAPLLVASLLGLEYTQQTFTMAVRHLHVVWRVVYIITHLFTGLMIVVIASTLAVAAFRIMAHGTIAATNCLIFLVNATIEGAMSLFVFLSAVVVNWVVGMALSVLQVIVTAIYGPLQILQKRYAQRQEIRRIYHDDHTTAFKSFRSFKRFWDAVERGEEPAYPGSEPSDERANSKKETPRDRPPRQQSDPYKRALDLFGLKEPFDKKAFKTRYRKMMKAHHPDFTGDHRKAQDLNVAATIIKQRRRWK